MTSNPAGQPSVRRDPMIDEIREIRESFAKEHDYDLGRMCQALREIERRHAGRVRGLEEQSGPERTGV